MKINEVIVEERLNENFLDLDDFSTFIKSVWGNLGKVPGGLSWQDIKDRAFKDRQIRAAGKDMLQLWKNTKYELLQAKQGEEPTQQELKMVLDNLVTQMGADPSDVQPEVAQIIAAQDRLNNKKIIDLFTIIVTSSVANQMKQQTGQDVEPGGQEDQTDEPEKQAQQQEESKPFDYGTTLAPEIRLSDNPDNYHPVTIITVVHDKDQDGNPVPEGIPRRYIMWNGDWYTDKQSEGVDITINEALKVSPVDDVNLLDYLIKQRKLNYWQIKQPNNKYGPAEVPVEFVGIEKVDAGNFRLPSEDEQAAWKTRTGRV